MAKLVTGEEGVLTERRVCTGRYDGGGRGGPGWEVGRRSGS